MNNNQTTEKIREVIESIRPYINMDGGDIRFIKYEKEIVYIEIIGACLNCAMLDITIKNGIYETLKTQIPEIKDVINLSADQSTN